MTERKKYATPAAMRTALEERINRQITMMTGFWVKKIKNANFVEKSQKKDIISNK